MVWILGSVGVAVALVAIAAAIGASLPREHLAARAARIGRPPEEIWAALVDLDGQPAWRKGLRRVERLPDRDGRPVWREHGSAGPMTLTRLEQEPPRRLVGAIVDEGGPFGGTWTYELAADGGGTRVTITERGWVGPAIFRFLARYVFGHHAAIDAYLTSLGGKFGERVEPGPA